MRPPVYFNETPKKCAEGNTGLFFQRFFDRYKPDGSIEDGVKVEWLKQFKGISGDSEALESAAQSQYTLVDQLSGKAQVFTTDWHFVTGMGYPHPVENGLNWHPVYGVPYLSGAAVKGMVRAWVEQWLYSSEEASEKRARLLSWFGSEEKFPENSGSPQTMQAGDLVFFDAVPVKPVQLNTDIMTPHMGKWYEKGGEISSIQKQPDCVPADWHSPTPIPFLAVKQASYLFSVAPRNAKAAQRVDMDEVMKCLESALNFLGAGAKTATGYGQMNHDESATEKILTSIEEKRVLKEREACQSMLSPFESELEALIEGSDNPAITLFQKLEEGYWSGSDEQVIVAQRIKTIWEAEKGKWNPDFSGKNKKAVKQSGRCKKVMGYLR
ncbi:MAG TPA: type III-B CRISPR module RAMP protein Cmr6 [Gammaproteobacteria bacterium]|nr:type III-B CRISPR module RAMP protein Cmr6 [Gammaproteobacteria bacterium]